MVVERSAAETCSTSDTAGAEVTLGRGAADTCSTSDTLARETIYDRAIAETCSTADTAATEKTGGVERTIQETCSVSDTLAREAQYVRELAETCSATDTVTAGLVIECTAQDTCSATDTVTAAAVFTRTAQETAAVVDQLTRAAEYRRDIAETASAADQVSGVIEVTGTLYTRNPEETCAVTDTVAVDLRRFTTLHNVRRNFAYQLEQLTLTSTAVARGLLQLDSLRQQPIGNSSGRARDFTIRRVHSDADNDPIEASWREAWHEYELRIAYPSIIGDGDDLPLRDLIAQDRDDISACLRDSASFVGIAGDAARNVGLLNRYSLGDEIDTDGPVCVQRHVWRCLIRELV
jgi:hypothetical protein